MVSFSCENCGDVLTKKKLDPHRNQCHGASFTCIDCMVHFYGTEYRAHTSCISEAQKYQGHLYREKGKKGNNNNGDKRKSVNGQDNSQAMIARSAYVEDAPEGDEMNAVAVVDVPPRAPTPPPAPEALPENVNVFDFLVQDATPHKNGAHQGKRQIEYDSQYSNGDSNTYLSQGYSYGSAPVQPSMDRYDSWQNMTDSQQSQSLAPPPPYTTPAPRHDKSDRKSKDKSDKSDKKRKRQQVEELDLSTAKRPQSRDAMIVDPPTSASRVLHSGLTGGLSRLVTDPEFYDDRIEAGPTPISPTKRKRGSDRDPAKDDRRRSSYTSYSIVSKPTSSRLSGGREEHARSRDRESTLSDERHRQRRRHHHHGRSSSVSSAENTPRHRSSTRRAIEYPDRPGSVQPSANNQLAIPYSTRGELFLSFVSKGPESERGYSMNKALKRYHRERDLYGTREREEDDKELWKSLRLRRNERGEIVLFMGE